jgi:hypothetical protein
VVSTQSTTRYIVSIFFFFFFFWRDLKSVWFDCILSDTLVYDNYLAQEK